MAGLVNYGSSDEEDGHEGETSQELHFLHATKAASLARASMNGVIKESEANSDEATKLLNILPPETPSRLSTPNTLLLGPVLGPSNPLDAAGILEPLGEQEFAPQSPYSAKRVLLRDLTLPSIPNYDIPSSPSGSPLASTDTKFKHFLGLKKQDVHFNEKLARSLALKNPSLMQKLMDFSEIDDAGQYGTILSIDSWNPNAFPESAYKEDLVKSQQKIMKSKDEEKSKIQRESVDFVSASASTESSNRHKIPGAASHRSAAEKVMSGLNGGLSTSPQVHGMKRKTRFES